MTSASRRFIPCLVAIAGLALACPVAAQTAPDVVILSPNQGDLGDLLKQRAAEARAHKLIPVVELGHPDCRPCKELDAALGNPLMKDAFASIYVIRLEDIRVWKGQLKLAGLDGHVLPVFYALGADGRPDGRKIDGGAWGENTPENMAPPLKNFFQGLR